MQDSFAFNLLIAFFVVAPVFQFSVAFLLHRALRVGRGRNYALIERLLGGVALFVSSLFLSVLALNRLIALHVPDELVLVLFMAALMLMSVPAFIWLFIYFTGRFRE